MAADDSSRPQPEHVLAVGPTARHAPDKPARLEVHVGPVHVVLEGDPSFVLQAYREVHAQVTDAIRAASTPPAAPEPTRAPEKAAPSSCKPSMRGSRPMLPRSISPSREVLWVSRCKNDVRKVYATERRRFASSPFAQRYGLEAVEHIFVEDDRLLRVLKKDSETLWFEVDAPQRPRF